MRNSSLTLMQRVLLAIACVFLNALLVMFLWNDIVVRVFSFPALAYPDVLGILLLLILCVYPVKVWLSIEYAQVNEKGRKDQSALVEKYPRSSTQRPFDLDEFFRTANLHH